MCGIVVSISDSASLESTRPLDDLRRINQLRGPDFQETLSTTIESGISINYTSSVLHLRGDNTTAQPHRNERGDILCWNGEIFDGLEIDLDKNDGARLFALLTARDPDVLDIMNGLEGPFAFAFYQSSTKTLFFGRDPLGRRSLLVHYPSDDDATFTLASVSLGPSQGANQFLELSADYIYALDVTKVSKERIANIQSHISPHPRTRKPSSSGQTFSAHHTVNPSLPPTENPVPASNNELSPEMAQAVDAFSFQLERSVERRLRNIPLRGSRSVARLAILFSGGIDCAVLAYLANKYIPANEPIDLLNVAFENPRKLKAASTIHPKLKENGATQSGMVAHAETYSVPDRKTGLEQLAELTRLCPGRKWNFVEVNVTFEESSASRNIVESLMFPSDTVMDLSLALALYFASRGQGQLHGTNESYTSPAKVLLSGLGSDELLGGYSRHRVAFRQGGWEGLVNELQLDLDRLPSRNLGRDDRVISTHGRETRYPYLDLSFVSFVASLPVHLKCDPRMDGEFPLTNLSSSLDSIPAQQQPRRDGGQTGGAGDKRLLREVARRKYGLVEAAQRRKRAMQFGSRSAKMTGGEDEKKGDLKLRNGGQNKIG